MLRQAAHAAPLTLPGEGHGRPVHALRLEARASAHGQHDKVGDSNGGGNGALIVCRAGWCAVNAPVTVGWWVSENSLRTENRTLGWKKKAAGPVMPADVRTNAHYAGRKLEHGEGIFFHVQRDFTERQSSYTYGAVPAGVGSGDASGSQAIGDGDRRPEFFPRAVLAKVAGLTGPKWAHNCNLLPYACRKQRRSCHAQSNRGEGGVENGSQVEHGLRKRSTLSPNLVAERTMAARCSKHGLRHQSTLNCPGAKGKVLLLFFSSTRLFVAASSERARCAGDRIWSVVICSSARGSTVRNGLVE